MSLGGVGQTVAGNELSHAPHSAIIFSGNDHLIERNEIFDVLRETGDCGAIYCGRDWTLHGTRIRHNFIHDLRGEEGRWQNAIYLDDMASGIVVTENLILRCHWGMLIGGGRDLEIAGNVFADCDLGIRFDARGVGWMAKHIADPETSTLHRRLAAMPVDRPPWSERFPSLQSYLSDRFGRPAGSRVVGNLFLATPFGSVVDGEAVAVAGNEELPDPPAWLGPQREFAGVSFAEDCYRGIPLAAIGRRNLVLAEHGTSEWTIVVPDAAREAERDAARRLQDFIRRMSGVELPIGTETATSPPGRRILIGATRAAGSGAIDPGSLGEDGFRIRVVGDDLYLVGGVGLGIDYAVTEVLERLGCRFWAPGALQVPESPALRLPGDLDATQVPKVWFRHVNYGPALDPEYRRWHRLDRIQEEVGRLWAPRWVHSMFHYVPPERYFAEHPEYYALIGGERQPTQLCLTNPEVLQITIEGVRKVLEKHPDVRYVSISQEDNYAHCQCAEARRDQRARGQRDGGDPPLRQRRRRRLPGSDHLHPRLPVHAQAAEAPAAAEERQHHALHHRGGSEPPDRAEPGQHLPRRFRGLVGDLCGHLPLGLRGPVREPGLTLPEPPGAPAQRAAGSLRTASATSSSRATASTPRWPSSAATCSRSSPGTPTSTSRRPPRSSSRASTAPPGPSSGATSTSSTTRWRPRSSRS